MPPKQLSPGGARKVEVGRCQLRQIKASGGYMSSDPIVVQFGMGRGDLAIVGIHQNRLIIDSGFDEIVSLVENCAV